MGSPSCAVRLLSTSDRDYKGIDGLTAVQLDKMVTALMHHFANRGMNWRLEASSIDWSKYSPARQTQTSSKINICLTGVGTAMYNSHLMRDGSVIINRAGLLLTPKVEYGEYHYLNAMSQHLQNYHYPLRYQTQNDMEFLPLVRLVVKGILRILYRRDDTSCHVVNDTTLNLLESCSSSRVGSNGFCGDLEIDAAKPSKRPTLDEDDALFREVLSWKHMCLFHDPSKCTRDIESCIPSNYRLYEEGEKFWKWQQSFNQAKL